MHESSQGIRLLPIVGGSGEQVGGGRQAEIYGNALSADAVEREHKERHACRVRAVPRRPSLRLHQRAAKFHVQGQNLQAFATLCHLRIHRLRL